jgi:hypothetical protein
MDINNEIIELWETHEYDLAKWYKDEKKPVLAPMLYPELKMNSLLTIGINPSFSEDGFKKLTKDNPISDIWDHYSFKNLEMNYQEWVEFEIKARKEYPYYNKIKEIKKKLRIRWSHIDLYYIRATEQKSFLKKLNNYLEFKTSQIDLTRKIIREINPRMILVANKQAIPEFVNMFKNNAKQKTDINWCKMKGCYITTFGKKDIPTHFSGQLKYLDTESFKRLKWMMKFTLK